MSDVKPIPEGHHTVTPHLVVKGAREAIAFYEKAFGAEAHYCMDGPNGSVMHGEIRIGDSLVYIADEWPGMEYFLAPTSIKGTACSLHIYCADVDAAYKRAIDAGATVVMEPMDAFWGDRYGRLRDPFGHEWSLATHVADLTPEEIAKGAEEWMKHCNKDG